MCSYNWFSFRLTGFYPSQRYPEQLRIIRYWDDEQKREFMFLTNNFELSVLQIYTAIITYCLVAIVQHYMRLERSTYEVLQILSISLTDKTPLADLFAKTNFNNVNERNGYKEPYMLDLFENFKY